MKKFLIALLAIGIMHTGNIFAQEVTTVESEQADKISEEEARRLQEEEEKALKEYEEMLEEMEKDQKKYEKTSEEGSKIQRIHFNLGASRLCRSRFYQNAQCGDFL